MDRRGWLGQGPGGNAFPTLVVPEEVVSGRDLAHDHGDRNGENTGDVLTITQTTTAPFLADFTHTPSTSPATATLSGTAPALSQGNYEVIWSVSDGVNHSVTATTTVIVTEGADPTTVRSSLPSGTRP